MNSQITIPAAPGSVASGALAVPAGTVCIRVEVIISDADFAIDRTFNGSATIALGPFQEAFAWSNDCGPSSSGTAMTGGVLFNEPSPAGMTVSGALACVGDPTCLVGAIVSFADSAENMPPSQREGG